jgi:dihydrofolate reductase
MRLVAIDHLTLDGVMQSPGGRDEDPRGGFEHGGWAARGNDDVMLRKMQEGMSGSGSMLFGRFTYEAFYAYWPHQTNNPYTDVLDRARKYVASRTLSDPLPWENSTLLGGDVAEAVAKLKEPPGPDIVVLGSGDLLQTLMRHDLVDRYVLMIHPLVLGSGRRLFGDGTAPRRLRLTDSVTTTTDVTISTYERA